MANKKSSSGNSLSRRQFLTGTGITLAALMMPNSLMGCSTAAVENPGVTSMENVEADQSNTDVLVIGGGMAGAFAAVKAKEQGVNVTLIDKGTVGRSGSTPWANTFNVFDSSTDDRDEWYAGVSASSEYVNNLDWLDQLMDNSMDAWNDINEWGLLDSNVTHSSLVLRDKLLAEGVTLIERTMVTTLLTDDDGQVIGAMGFSIDSEVPVVVLAKATILCAGAGSFKASGFPIQGLTSDSDAMAYRAGARITGKEWCDFHWTSAENPASCWSQWANMWDTGISKTSGTMNNSMTLDSALVAHQGLATVSSSSDSSSMMMPGGDAPEGEMPEGDMPEGEEGERPEGPPPDGEEGEGGRPERDGDGEEGGTRPGQSSGTQILGAATGLGIHKAEGVWPSNMQGACNVPGLYAAGDALGSMLCGASYAGIGFSLSGSAVQGGIAGEAAATYAKALVEEPTLSDEKIAALQSDMFGPRGRSTGFTPAWVTQLLQNAMFPYYVLFVKEQSRMEAALSTVMFLKEHLTQYLVAQDAHELKLAHETENMILNAEMKLRSAMLRTESRGTHYREDYPSRDDDNWLVWILMSQDSNGDMQLSTVDIPDEWKPDASLSYAERYATRFPGEFEYLGLA